MGDHIVEFEDAAAKDVSIVGGKGAGLARLVQTGFDVPEGFILTKHAFDLAMRAAGIDSDSVGRMVSRHPASYTNIRMSSANLRKRTLRAGIPTLLLDEIRRAVGRLDGNSFAVRSSAIDEDSSGHSFAGMNESFTNLSTVDEIEDAVLRCWASAFGQRVLAYRALHKMSSPIEMAVVVQTMIDAHRAGVMFTSDPASSSDDIVIEAALGQGEVVVGGRVEPDTFIVRRDGNRRDLDNIASIHVGAKDHMITRDAGGARVRTDLHGSAAAEPCLSETEILDLADIGTRIERAFGAAQDIEWCFDPAGRIWVVQSRPITTTPSSGLRIAGIAETGVNTPAIIRGLAAAPGSVTGPVRVAASLEEARALAAGEILVAEMTTPDWILIISRAAGVVTDRGGVTSHAAIVSRELGVPAVVGTRVGSKTFVNGDIVRVDGDRGIVERIATEKKTGLRPTTSEPEDAHPMPELRTKVFVNLSHPRNAASVADTPGVDGIGLLRAEFLLTEALGGVHPGVLIENGRSNEFVDILATTLEEIARPFGDRPIVYRTADFRSNEFRHLEGGERFEPEEENPMIGFRGCFRYVRDPAMFKLEVEALDRVRRVSPGLTLMIPFVRTLWELQRCLELVIDTVDTQLPRLSIWIMAEVPSVLYRIADYRKLGVSGISIGTNDLTQLMLGVDRDSEICSELFDEQDAAVVAAISDIIHRARSAGMSTSLCGQAPSNHPEFARELVRMGIDSVSVDPSAVVEVRQNLALAEASTYQKEKQ